MTVFRGIFFPELLRAEKFLNGFYLAGNFLLGGLRLILLSLACSWYRDTAYFYECVPSAKLHVKIDNV